MIISIVFIVIFFINLSLNSRIDLLKTQLDTKISKLEEYTSLENSYIRVAKSLDVYKAIVASKTSVYSKTLAVYANVPEGIVINDLNVTEDSFNINLSSGDLLLFSGLLAQYLRNPLISGVVLESATLNSSTQEYLVNLKGSFK